MTDTIDEDVTEQVQAVVLQNPTTWGKVKNALVKCLGALVMEYGVNGWAVSIGRVAFWFAFIPALYLWIWKERDIDPNHFSILLILIGYNFSKKGISVLEQVLNKKLGTTDEVK